MGEPSVSMTLFDVIVAMRLALTYWGVPFRDVDKGNEVEEDKAFNLVWPKLLAAKEELLAADATMKLNDLKNEPHVNVNLDRLDIDYLCTAAESVLKEFDGDDFTLRAHVDERPNVIRVLNAISGAINGK